MTKVTVVDDDADSRNLLYALLRSNGFTVSLFSSAEAFLEATDHVSDLYMLDINLGGMPGNDLCVFIKNEKDKNKPVIIISAHPDIQNISTLACADAYLGKPFSPRELVSQVRAILAR